jgi:hypothetical protein
MGGRIDHFLLKGRAIVCGNSGERAHVRMIIAVRRIIVEVEESFLRIEARLKDRSGTTRNRNSVGSRLVVPVRIILNDMLRKRANSKKYEI